MSRPHIYIIGIVVLMLAVACKPGTPKQYIQPRQMEDILVDYHLAKALAEQDSHNGKDADYLQTLYIDAVLEKHGVTQADFDSSLVYYYIRADRFKDICKHVADRLEQQAVALGATASEIGQFGALNAEGDTANVWTDRERLVLMPQPPYNRFDFVIDCDTTYRRGDSFLLQFQADYMYQNGSREGQVVLAVTYEGDSVVSQTTALSSTGNIQLRMAANNKQTPKKISGFIYLGGGNEKTTTMRLLFVSQLQLIRFHNNNLPPIDDNEHEEATDSTDAVSSNASTDSLPRIEAPGRGPQPIPTGPGDPRGPRPGMVPTDRGVPPHGMDGRMHHPVPDPQRPPQGPPQGFSPRKAN